MDEYPFLYSYSRRITVCMLHRVFQCSPFVLCAGTYSEKRVHTNRTKYERNRACWRQKISKGIKQQILP